MTTATIMAVAIEAVAVVPLLLLLKFSRAVLPVLGVCSAMAAGFSLYYMGLPQPGAVAPLERSAPPRVDRATPASPQCGEAVGVLEENGILLERNSAQVVVRGEAWRQLPEQVREVLAICLSDSTPDGSPARPPQIVER